MRLERMVKGAPVWARGADRYGKGKREQGILPAGYQR